MDLQLPDIKSLCKLFDEIDPNRQNDDSDTELECGAGFKGPGDIGQGDSKSSKSSSDTGVSSNPKNSSSGIHDKSSAVLDKSKIWSPKEVKGVDESELEDVNISITNDPRTTPTYTMHYSQCVTSEDIFLQMGNKTPSSASCENLVVEIHLPHDDFQKVQLNLKKQAIDLRSPIHFLYLNLPHPIDPRAGTAKWNRDTEKLTITLKLTRELDPFNF